MASITSEWYAGSRLLAPVSDLIGVPLDQINFLICQVVALLLGIPFRNQLGPHKVSASTRHQFELVAGLILTLFCFSYQTWHVLIQATISLLMMRFIEKDMAKWTFIMNICYLSICHLYRQYYDNGIYCLDITGPLMISTQRLSSLAYSIQDGQVEDESKLTTNQKIQAVKKFPSVLEFYSYTFSFHGVLLGPFCFYNDYVSFIEGHNLIPSEQYEQSIQEDESKKIALQDKQPTPSPLDAVFRKILLAVCCFVIMFTILPSINDDMQGDYFNSKSFLGKMIFIVLLTTTTRSKYYFAWFLGEAVNNNAGLGISGRDNNGKRKWDLVNNADVAKVEVSTSLKVVLDGWNVTTTYWLRHTVYERVTFQNTMMVFVVSALWHGFYPGYYFTFLAGAAFILLGRKFRRGVRPRFQISPQMQLAYDAMTFIATRLVLGYTTFPFLTLTFGKTFHVYWHTFFCLHLIGIIFFFTVPGGKRRPPAEKKSDTTETTQSKAKPE